jgi:hypothetical protein
MCYTCGCKLPFEDHGDPRNLTEKNLRDATMTEAAKGADIAKVKESVEELIRLEGESDELSEPKQQY